MDPCRKEITSFTAQDIIAVYLARWRGRDAANSFLGWLHEDTVLDKLNVYRPL